MSAPPYMKLYVGDYLGDTHHLGVTEHGAYLLLLMSMWRAGGSLPAADSNLARLARCTPEQWAEIRDAVLPFFKVSRGRITHKRIGEEMAKYENTSCKRSEAGKAGVAKKARKNNDPSSAIASDTESNCIHNQNQNHIVYSEDKSSGAEAPSRDLFADDPNATAWAMAIRILTEQGGLKDAPARSYFGRLLSANKLEAREMLPALGAALANQTGSPQSYLTKSAKGVADRKSQPATTQKRVGFV